MWTPSAATRIAPGGAASSPIFGEGRLLGGVFRDKRRQQRQELGSHLSVRGGGIILIGIFCVFAVFVVSFFFTLCKIMVRVVVTPHVVQISI